MPLSKDKHHVLILCVNPYIRIEFQDYLHSLLGDYVLFDTAEPESITDSSQLQGYSCILFSSTKVQLEFPVPIPQGISQIVCTRTFNHAYLDQIIQIPPGEKVYVVNDSMESTLHIIREFEEVGISQYQFIPFIGDTQETDLSIRYAITLGEPQLVPRHVRNIINIGNRIIDISTVNELCVLFHLPANLGNRITKNYISHILKVVKTAGNYYGSFIFSQQLLQASMGNLPLSICLLDERGTIILVNKSFARDWGLSEKNSLGHSFLPCIPESHARISLNQTGDYHISNRQGIPLILSVMDLSFPNHVHVSLLTSKLDPTREPEEDGSEEVKHTVLPGRGGAPSPVERQRNSFMDLITTSEKFQEVLSYARRMSLYDFPILIQGEYGTQKKRLAKAIHRSSRRRNQPFISLNQLLAFTDYAPGQILETIDHGTLLVDNIQLLPPDKQEFLIQLLNSHSGEGYFSLKSFDIRLIATSAVPLYPLVQQGLFREDLFFQLSAAVLDTVPLKERREDIPLLLDDFFQNMFHDPKFDRKTILSKSLYQFLLQYDYPGNVQELTNLAQYFYSLYAARPLLLSQLPAYIRNRIPSTKSRQSTLKREVLSIIRRTPRAGRSTIQKALADSGVPLSDGKLRGLLKELGEEGLILIHRTKGGCEITEAGIALIKEESLKVPAPVNSPPKPPEDAAWES